VIGTMRDKDIDGMIGALLPAVSSVVATAATNPRAFPAAELAARIRAVGGGVDVRAESDPAAAVERALSSRRTVCVAGSLFVVGAVRERFERRAILR
jgi:dihydrofolate synthase/folylpolyglutamate synthase